MLMNILPLYMYVLHFRYPQRSEEDIRFHGTAVEDVCEPPCGCWNQNPGSLRKGQMLFNVGTTLKTPFLKVLTQRF